jgi:hypothetical protein
VRNEAYWQNVDYIISQAKARDMLVILAPAYLGSTCGDEGWCANMQAQTDAAMANYGTWIGNRYKNSGNIIWLDAVDANAQNYPNAMSRVNSIANAIQATSSTYLQTAQSSRTRSALDDYNQPWLSINTTYTATDPATLIKNDYQRSGALPFIHIEGYYENENSSSISTLRSEALITYLGGALCGHIFGNDPMWYFGSGWQTALNSQGSVSMGNIASLLKSRSWWKLTPDYTNTVVTSNKGSGFSYKATARTSDGATVMIWNPTSTSVTVDMTKINGSDRKSVV